MISNRLLAKGAIWTIGAYGFTQVLRLGTSVALTRLLAPEIFGIMLVVNSLRTGVDLISDLGVGQNIVHNSNADDPDFYNTAWTLQAIRGVILWIICAAATLPLSRSYESSILLTVTPVAALAFVFSGFTSVSRYLLQKRLQLVRLNCFEVMTVIASCAATILAVYLSPTIWALIVGSLVGYLVPMLGSYFLIPGLQQRFLISRKYLKQILHFGVWIFLSSIVYFFSTNFDRLYLARIIPFEFLGIYGIARNISELLGLLTLRIASVIIFPLVVTMAHQARSGLRERLSVSRFRFLLVGALGFSLLAAVADLLVNFVYDQRYQAAGWMLSILILGGWFSTLCSVNESTLLGLGRPSYGAIANSIKLGYLLVAMPLSFSAYGSRGSVIVIAASDLLRYFPILMGQRRESFSFGRQDLLTTIIMLMLTGVWEWMRWFLGFGTSFDALATATFV
jgi:O-antigen/teichoic acid export membrane protein